MQLLNFDVWECNLCVYRSGEFLSIFLTSFNNLGYEKVAGESDALTVFLFLIQALFFIKYH